MTRRRWIALIVTLITGGSVLGVAAVTRRESVAVTSPSPPARPVRVQEVRATADAAPQTFTGVVRARHETDVAFRVGGKLVMRLVDVGTVVRKGQVLARLDPEDATLALRAAEAELASATAGAQQAKLDFDRSARLLASSAVPAAETDRTRTGRDAADAAAARARAEVELARNRVAYSTLYADSDGVVTSVTADAGQVVGQGQVIARVARPAELEAVVSIPESRVASVRTGAATVAFWSLPGTHRAVILRELAPTADPATRTYEARFSIRDPGPEVQLGMTATVELRPIAVALGYSLPLTALSRQGARPAVWVVDRGSGHLTLTAIDVAEYRPQTVVVAKGLTVGDLVVTAGVQKLDAGMTVRPWESAP